MLAKVFPVRLATGCEIENSIGVRSHTADDQLTCLGISPDVGSRDIGQVGIDLVNDGLECSFCLIFSLHSATPDATRPSVDYNQDILSAKHAS